MFMSGLLKRKTRCFCTVDRHDAGSGSNIWCMVLMKHLKFFLHMMRRSTQDLDLKSPSSVWSILEGSRASGTCVRQSLSSGTQFWRICPYHPWFSKQTGRAIATNRAESFLRKRKERKMYYFPHACVSNLNLPFQRETDNYF